MGEAADRSFARAAPFAQMRMRAKASLHRIEEARFVVEV